MKNLPASGWGTSKPRPAFYPTKDASTVSSLCRMGPLWSHVSYDAEGEGKSRWLWEGHTRSQSMSPKSSSLLITHTSQPTPWGCGFFSCLWEQLPGSMHSLKPPTSYLTGSPTQKSSITESGSKSVDKSKQKSASSQDTVPSCKRPLTTVGVDLKPGGSPSCYATSRVKLASPTVKDTRVED